LAGFTAQALEDRWILSRFNRVAQEIDDSLKAYRFDEAANRVYSFFWGEFCDWYVELIKPRMFELESEAGKQAAKIACQNTVVVFEAALRLLSPMMPFITEEIWHAIYNLQTHPSAEQHGARVGHHPPSIVLKTYIREELVVERRFAQTGSGLRRDGDVHGSQHACNQQA
jgi:valyl-tRNA synthetase